MRDMINFNSKGQRHGYQQGYWNGDGLFYRGNWRNDGIIGYTEWHAIKETEYYIR